MSIRRLREVVTPPVRNSDREYSWETIEADLQFPLPTDYKELIETYGPGSFGDFLHIYQPNSPWEQLDLKQQAEEELWALRELAEDGAHIPYQLADPAELISFGRNDNGDPLFWHRPPGTHPDTWTVVVKEARSDEWFSFAGGVTEFLHAVLTGEVQVTVFPKDFPPDIPEFAPYVAS
ncbi:SMI1/KNR4 family protein [Streptomyces sp. NPDC045369]|uniref:SMI1/KNR4 family protein n=1 Tax=Streptomyces sp. NPDC045369 TaxID=3155732 RepID=UPI0033FED18D